MKFTCIICGHKSLDARCEWDICPICFWEDDVILRETDKQSSANAGLKVSEAQANYIVFGCCSMKHVANVRQATSDEVIDPSWQPLPAAITLSQAMRDKESS